jgi:hypothetical protein
MFKLILRGDSMQYSLVLDVNKVIKFDRLQEAVIFFYVKVSELLNNVIEFYDNNQKILTWVKGKGITTKP